MWFRNYFQFIGVFTFLSLALSLASEKQVRAYEETVEMSYFPKPSLSTEFTSLASLSNSTLALRMEYLPPFFQGFGVLGIGGIASATDTTGAVRLKNMSGLGFGAYLRYQFQYIPSQTFVPYVGYTVERRSYNPGAAPPLYWTSLHSPFFGMQLLLNNLEPNAARTALFSSGIKRSYLITEFRDSYVHDSQIKFSNYDVFVGLRLEY